MADEMEWEGNSKVRNKDEEERHGRGAGYERLATYMNCAACH